MPDSVIKLGTENKTGCELSKKQLESSASEADVEKTLSKQTERNSCEKEDPSLSFVDENKSKQKCESQVNAVGGQKTTKDLFVLESQKITTAQVVAINMPQSDDCSGNQAKSERGDGNEEEVKSEKVDENEAAEKPIISTSSEKRSYKTDLIATYNNSDAFETDGVQGSINEGGVKTNSRILFNDIENHFLSGHGSTSGTELQTYQHSSEVEVIDSNTENDGENTAASCLNDKTIEKPNKTSIKFNWVKNKKIRKIDHVLDFETIMKKPKIPVATNYDQENEGQGNVSEIQKKDSIVPSANDAHETLISSMSEDQKVYSGEEIESEDAANSEASSYVQENEEQGNVFEDQEDSLTSVCDACKTLTSCMSEDKKVDPGEENKSEDAANSETLAPETSTANTQTNTAQRVIFDAEMVHSTDNKVYVHFKWIDDINFRRGRHIVDVSDIVGESPITTCCGQRENVNRENLRTGEEGLRISAVNMQQGVQIVRREIPDVIPVENEESSKPSTSGTEICQTDPRQGPVSEESESFAEIPRHFTRSCVRNSYKQKLTLASTRQKNTNRKRKAFTNCKKVKQRLPDNVLRRRSKRLLEARENSKKLLKRTSLAKKKKVERKQRNLNRKNNIKIRTLKRKEQPKARNLKHKNNRKTRTLDSPSFDNGRKVGVKQDKPRKLYEKRKGHRTSSGKKKNPAEGFTNNLTSTTTGFIDGLEQTGTPMDIEACPRKRRGRPPKRVTREVYESELIVVKMSRHLPPNEREVVQGLRKKS